MVEAGPVITDPPGSHVKNVVEELVREVAIRSAEGSMARSDVPVTVAQRARAAPSDGPQFFERPGLFLIDGARFADCESGLPAASAVSCVGGMATQWTAACPRPAGSEWIPFLAHSLLRDAFTTAEDYLDVSDSVLANPNGSKFVARVLSELYDGDRDADHTVRNMPMAVSIDELGARTWSSTATILKPVARSHRFELRSSTRCLGIRMDGRRAVGVTLIDETSGGTYDVAARVIVVAAGSLHTPQLLFASGIRPAALGKHLNDHHMIVGAVRVPAVASEARTQGNRTASDSITGVTWIPADDSTLALHGQVMHTDASPIGTGGLSSEEEQIISLGFFAAKEVQWSDRVDFSDSEKDSRGMPRMTVHYTLTDRDNRIIELARTNIDVMTKALGSPAFEDNSYVMPRGYSLHYQGTIRMGSRNDGLSVCDRHSRVWDTDNVFVGGNGVIPTPTACNPTLTSVALAILGAHEVLRGL
jgi:choline dehydrogenase-like flavoprotein